MATWNVYVEYDGYPISTEIDFPDEYDEQEVYQTVLDDIMIDLTEVD